MGGSNDRNICSVATIDEGVCCVDVEDVVTCAANKLICACITDNPIVTTSTCEGVVSFAAGEEYAFGSSGVKFVFSFAANGYLNFSIGEVESAIEVIVEDGEGVGAVVFGGDLGVVVGLGDFKAGFGDEESDIGDLADGSIVAVEDGTGTDDVTVLDGLGGDTVKVNAGDTELGEGFEFVGFADAVLVEVLPDENLIKLVIRGGYYAVLVLSRVEMAFKPELGVPSP